MIPLIVATDYIKDAWTDPWGKPQWGYVVQDFALGLEMAPMPPVKYDYGYGPGSIVNCHIWRAADEDRLFVGRPPMDYGARTTFLEVVDIVDGSYDVQGPLFEQPGLGTAFVMDGEPWNVAQVHELVRRSFSTR